MKHPFWGTSILGNPRVDNHSDLVQVSQCIKHLGYTTSPCSNLGLSEETYCERVDTASFTERLMVAHWDDITGNATELFNSPRWMMSSGIRQ